MPNRDGTWPHGKGPMTGAKMGNCEQNGEKGKNVAFGRWKWNARCWQKKWLGNRWSVIEEEKKD